MTRRTLSLVVIALLAACSVEKVPLVATDVVISRPIPGMQMTAAYFLLSNNTTQAITITDVTSPNFESVEMHESALEDGMTRMYALGELTILAGATVGISKGKLLPRKMEEVPLFTVDYLEVVDD